MNRPGTNLDGINYLLNIKQWADMGEGWVSFGQRQREKGPTGFLDKSGEQIYPLTKWGYSCEGIDPDRCLWPTGVWSRSKIYGTSCAHGFRFSYELNQCF